MQAGWKFDAWQKLLVATLFAQLFDMGRIIAPEAYAEFGTREMDGQRGPPGAGAEYSNVSTTAGSRHVLMRCTLTCGGHLLLLDVLGV